MQYWPNRDRGPIPGSFNRLDGFGDLKEREYERCSEGTTREVDIETILIVR